MTDTAEPILRCRGRGRSRHGALLGSRRRIPSTTRPGRSGPGRRTNRTGVWAADRVPVNPTTPSDGHVRREVTLPSASVDDDDSFFHLRQRGPARVDAEIALEVGRALRHARRSRGLTLREVGMRSGGALRPTAVAGYERGERDISLRRFIQLAGLYAIPPARLVGEIDRRIQDRPQVTIDVPAIERLGTTEGMLVADFVHEVRTLRRSGADV